MKTIAKILLFGTAAAVLTGCKPSSISNQETMFIPEGAVIQEETTIGWTVPETSKYVIPENAPTGEAGGPGAMETTAVDYSVYPENKRPVAAEPDDENKVQVILYRQTDLGLKQDFDALDVCDAESLIAALEKAGAFKSGTEVVDFTVDGDTGHLELSKLDIYKTHDEYVVLSGIANTFIDNLGLKKIEILVGGEDMGTYEFTYDL